MITFLRSQHRVRARLALLVLCLALACKAPPLPESQVPTGPGDFASAPRLEDTRLGAGDVVGVVVLGQPELSSPADGVPLDPGGRLRLPLIGAVDLAGLTLEEAESTIEARLATYVKRPDVTLWLLDSRSLRYFVLGSVRQPGRFPLESPLNAYQALALAGGVIDGGDRSNVCLLRERDGYLDVHLFDVRTPNQSGLVPIHPGDVLFIRLSGSGRFREQVLPILQGVAPAFSSLINLGLVADAIND